MTHSNLHFVFVFMLPSCWSRRYQHPENKAIGYSGKLCVILLADPLRQRRVRHGLLYGTVCEHAKVWQCTLMVMKVDCRLQRVWCGKCALWGGSYLGTLARCHSRCCCWCRSLWQCENVRCHLPSSRTLADTWMSHCGPRWSHHRLLIHLLGHQDRHMWSLSEGKSEVT